MLLDLFVYPVSGVLKLWHLLLHDVFNLQDSVAWVLSVFGLVIVVRSLIAPFSLIQSRSGRISALMRPAMRELDAEYRTRTDKKSVAEYRDKKKQLQLDYGYTTAAGCIPPLIQLPVFIGLYRFLLLMARPEDGLNAATHPSIGFLSSEDVSAFLDGRVFGVPLPAFVAMSEAEHAMLGTTRGEVLGVVLPLLIVAILFTSLNFALSMYRNALTMDWHSKMARGLSRFLVVMFLLVPVLLAWLALAGPLPAAIVVYWVANNLWTVVQATIIHFKVQRDLPLGPEHHELRVTGKAEHETRVQEAKEERARRKQLQLKARRDPAERAAIRAKLAAEDQEIADARAAEKAERKRLNKEKSAARIALQRDKSARRRAERAARKRGEPLPTSEEPAAEPTVEQAEELPPEAGADTAEPGASESDRTEDERPPKNQME